MELWERSDALAALEDTLRVTARAGRIALVAGEAGIGKSTLVQAFADACGVGVRVLWGRCDPLVTPRASGPLQDIGRQVGGLLGARLAAGASQSELFAALIDELSGPRQRPRRVVVIEDVHWADEATLDLLVFLGRRIDRLPALLVLTYRDDEVGAEHPLHTTLAALPRHVLRAIPVPALTRLCVAEQAALVGRDPMELYDLTGGNPLLVTELLAADDRTVPGTARDLILARLRQLSAPARDVAWLVAVMPTSADAVVLADVVDQVDECIAAGVLMSRADAVSYRHELLRQAVEDSLAPARRVALHRRALTLLAAVDGIDPARLVHHARHAGAVAALLRYAVVAAVAAATQGAHREAVAHYRAVRPHVVRLPPGQRAQVLEAYGREAYLAGVAGEGLAAQQAALAERERLGDRVLLGENLRWVSRLAWWSGHGATARAAAVRAVEVLEQGKPNQALAMAYSNRSQLHMLAYDLPAAIEWGERARELADRLGDVETSIHASVNVSTAQLLEGDLAGAVNLLHTHAAATAAGLVDHATRALVNRATSLVEGHAYDVAPDAVEEALRYAVANDLDGYVQYLLGVRAMVRLEWCQWDAALIDADESLSRGSRSGVGALPALVARGRILSARGDHHALSMLDAAADHAYGTGELQRIGLVAAARAEHFLLAGDTDRAAAEARQGLALATEKGHPWFVGELGYQLWQATGEFDDLPGTPTPYRLMMAGDWAGAAAAWSERGQGYARVQALAAGDHAAITEALTTLHDLGAAQAAQRLRARLRRRGVTGVARGPRASTMANAAGLTTRQLEVLRLLADGLTYADIADRLTLSPKTVEHHVSAVLSKLNVATRGQAVAAAHRRGLIAQDWQRGGFSPGAAG